MITRRQKELLDYLQDYIGGHGYAPTLDEIGRHFGLTSLATVHKHLQNLEPIGVGARNLSECLVLQPMSHDHAGPPEKHLMPQGPAPGRFPAG